MPLPMAIGIKRLKRFFIDIARYYNQTYKVEKNLAG
jgi:hypothetical protein